MFTSVSSKYFYICVIRVCSLLCHQGCSLLCHLGMSTSVSSVNVHLCVIRVCLLLCHQGVFNSLSSGCVHVLVIRVYQLLCHHVMNLIPILTQHIGFSSIIHSLFNILVQFTLSFWAEFVAPWVCSNSFTSVRGFGHHCLYVLSLPKFSFFMILLFYICVLTSI